MHLEEKKGNSARADQLSERGIGSRSVGDAMLIR